MTNESTTTQQTPTSTEAPTSTPTIGEFVAQYRAAQEAAQQAQEPAQQPAGATQETQAAEPTQAPATPQQRPEESVHDRLARKDAAYQEARNRARALEQQMQELRTQQEQMLAAFKRDPLAFAREQGVRFGDLAVAALGGDPQQEPPKPQDDVARELADLKTFRDELRREREEAAARSAREASVGAVRGYLESRDFPAVNDLGLHGQVYDLVTRHIGAHGGFSDDREAEEVVEFYARQVESAEAERIRSLYAKPGVRKLLGAELGAPAQKAAQPPRQDLQGTGGRNHAPAITNAVATERSAIAAPEEWDPQEALKRAIRDMEAARKRA